MATDSSSWQPDFASEIVPDHQASPKLAVEKPTKARRMLWLLYLAFGFQALGAVFFVGDLWSEVLGLRTEPIPWEWQEYIQTLASIGLITGVIVSGFFLRSSLRQMTAMRRQIDVAAGNFHDHLMNLFQEWKLSQSEQAVALFAMKGFSNGEIADLRGTSASTVKSQMNSIFRKSKLLNRQQLISHLVEDLLAAATEERG